MGTGMGGQSVEDMERVIAAMRRVIERLQSENDNLKKVKSKAPPHSDVARENRQLKARDFVEIIVLKFFLFSWI